MANQLKFFYIFLDFIAVFYKLFQLVVTSKQAKSYDKISFLRFTLNRILMLPTATYPVEFNCLRATSKIIL